ncbi:Hypothetical protein, putative [Bodo saltans]|uniref:Uncharacterized protein n=1 Tax=Bodo saltans TaxID=75058 RepID=A0A0S4JUB5_BODSA|nr:Hypothetical protein, putative [Bodo saltans]|eukprot:CUG94398.1 Hypothetical protein, putative [Bodo saltans]
MTADASPPLTSSPAVYEAPLRASVVQEKLKEKLTNNCTKISLSQRSGLVSHISLLQTFITEADKGQLKTEQMLALQILPLVRDVQQMVSLIDESVAKYDAAVLSHQRLQQLLATASPSLPSSTSEPAAH